jgi:hypothetical protein
MYPLHNLSTVQWICTTDKRIKSAKQVVECENMKNIPNFNLEKQPGTFHTKLPPTITSTVWLIPARQKMYVSKIYKFHFGEQSDNFKKLHP